MNLNEHRLVKLAEECSEVGQRAAKQMLFGPMEIQPGQPHENRERLREEIMDVLICVRALIAHGQVRDITDGDLDMHLQGKKHKIDRMLLRSIDHGGLNADERGKSWL